MWVRRAHGPARGRLPMARLLHGPPGLLPSFGSVTGEDTLSLRRDEMEALARLAHLHLPEHGAERLDQVLAWLAGLQAVDVEGVEEFDLDALARGSLESVALREDVPGGVLARDEVLAGVPVVDDGQVVLPRFVEE